MTESTSAYKAFEKLKKTNVHYPLHDFLIYFELNDLVHNYEINTLSGLILHELSHIPREGEN
ncbi:MAG: hypothetical protein KBF99_00240 [Leptospiraceae bacterium]|nr:hypothetical protein [Leptospiraceae bacterium]